ncbi:hypothetical protein [Paraburkholderia caribensis]|uniref:hypothetical protein n=1 Tax=Paraburkholderia caribensis TaxID=75105 RepID=UPI001D0896A0|nr:hypothetical protein [Paraburkholderia caribensis]
MSETFTLSSNALIRIFSLFNYPSDDTSEHTYGPWGPYGPGGPVLRDSLAQLAQALHVRSPTVPVLHPMPGAFAALGRRAVQHVVMVHDVAAASGGGKPAESATHLIDEYDGRICGNDLRWIYLHLGPRVPHHPEPPDPPIVRIDPSETIAFGMQFLYASKVLGDSPLSPAFAQAGKHVVTTGAEALEKSVG